MASKKEIILMSKKTAGSQKTVEIMVGDEKKEFLLQHPGVREGVQMRDRAKNINGHMVEEKLYDEYMKHVIVQPRVTWDDVEDMGNTAFNELMKEASDFCMG